MLDHRCDHLMHRALRRPRRATAVNLWVPPRFLMIGAPPPPIISRRAADAVY